MPETPIHILHLEDDDDDSFLFERAIDKAAIQAKIVRVVDVAGCMDILQTTYCPDIIFLDINVPAINGKQCLKWIRTQKQFDKTPIVMLTTSTSETDIQDTFESGANRFLTKPFRYEDLSVFFSKIFLGNWKETLLNTTFQSYVL